MKHILKLTSLLVILVFTGCKKENEEVLSPEMKLNTIAEKYIIQALSLGKYDENYVDAYFGPDYLKQKVENHSIKLDSIIRASRQLLVEVKAIDTCVYRAHNLACFIEALIAHAEFLGGKEMTFDEESEAIYGVKSPHYDSTYYMSIVQKIEKLLPEGECSINDRYEEMKSKFIVPEEKIDAVFSAAIDEARRRVKEHYPLDPNESFKSEYVKGKSWGAYNWFQGNNHSLIQVNTDLPFDISKAVHLASHEGYPGHHVFHSLIERKFVRKNAWVEYSIYPLFSPLSLISEGTANAGVAVAFPGEQLIEFELETLFPIAGLDTTGFRKYREVLKLMAELDYVSNDAARYYLDGVFTKEETIDYLVKYGCRSRERATLNVAFFDTYRSYVVNYNLGQDIIEDYIDKVVGNVYDAEEKRWEAFYNLISMPIMPKDLLQYGK